MLAFFDEFNITLSRAFITRWFYTIGTFKGSMRLTSVFPNNKYSWRVLGLLDKYLSFIVQIEDQRHLVFADKKLMKQRDLLHWVRRDPLTGVIPHIESDQANRRNRYNIFAATTVKRNVQRNVEFLIMEETGDAFFFREFVMHLVEVGCLVENDIFVVDNCSIHFHGENHFLWL